MKPIIWADAFNKKGHLIATARNSYTKTHPLQKYFAQRVGHPHKIYLHAEIASLLNAGKNKVYELKISRKNKLGQEMSSMPCPICQEALRAFGVKYITYTKNNKQIRERILYELEN
jgi:tRNA(Arg) A34 adenosine deaminase TadA